jgi:hypothetical protein
MQETMFTGDRETARTQRRGHNKEEEVEGGRAEAHWKPQMTTVKGVKVTKEGRQGSVAAGDTREAARRRRNESRRPCSMATVRREEHDEEEEVGGSGEVQRKPRVTEVRSIKVTKEGWQRFSVVAGDDREPART